MVSLYTQAELKRLSDNEILRLLQSHGHRGWEVDGETLDTPGGAARIHALTHSWAKNYPQVHWAPSDIQLLHELAVRQMKKWGFKHETPIEPELEAAIRERGGEAWKGKLRGVRGYVARSLDQRDVKDLILRLYRELNVPPGKRYVLVVRTPDYRINVYSKSLAALVELGHALRRYGIQATMEARDYGTGKVYWPAQAVAARVIEEIYDPATDTIKFYYSSKGLVARVSKPDRRELWFRVTPAQWRNYKLFKGKAPLRIRTEQILPGPPSGLRPIRR